MRNPKKLLLWTLPLFALLSPAALLVRLPSHEASKPTVPPTFPGLHAVAEADDLKTTAAQVLTRAGKPSVLATERLKNAALNLSRSELETLARIAATAKADGGERSLAIYLVAHANPDLSIQPLTSIALMAPSKEAADYSFAIGIALRALEALDRLAAENRANAKAAIHKIYESKTPDSVHFIASVSWNGIVGGHPGRVTPLMDHILQEASR
jgi:hypothetical protein